jgi:RNA polymerase sigma-70 factor, ECF subfamily
MIRDVTQLLSAWSEGDQAALDQLTPIVYDELRRLARRMMAGERPGHTLQTTAIVHEAYLRLADCNRMHWRDRAHFFAVSSQLMRRFLVDYSRRSNLKRGAGQQRVTFEEAAIVAVERSGDFADIDDALTALARIDTRKARVVDLRFFGGLSVEETAQALEVSTITVMRDFALAKAWLYRELSGQGNPSGQQ